MASGKKKVTQQGAVTLEALMDRLNEIDANQSVRAREEAERVLRREAALEERILRAVDDKISAAMADVRASLGSQPGDRLVSRDDDESVSGVKAKSKEAALFHNEKGYIGIVETVPEKAVEAEEDMDDINSVSASSNPHPMKFKCTIGNNNKLIYALIGTASSNSFIRPSVLKGVEECKLVSITPKVFEDIIGKHMVSDTKCQGLNYSIQGYGFKDDFLVMDIYGCDMVLGVDWMKRCGEVSMGGGYVSFKRNGQLVKLRMGEVTGSGKGNEIVAPQVMYIQEVRDEGIISQALKGYSNATDEKPKDDSKRRGRSVRYGNK